MMKITPQDVVQLPLHDARLLAIAFSGRDSGFDEISIRLKIHPDELFGLREKLPAMTEEFTLLFKKCSQINLNVNCFCTGNETIDLLDIVENSEIIQELSAFNLGFANSVHFRMQSSHGSLWDIVTSNVFIEGT